MRGYNFIRGLATVVVLLAVFATPALAQTQEPRATGWEGFFERADTGTVAVILIFGTALVAVLGGMTPGIVRACRGEVHTSEELIERIAQLENRIALLERQTVNR